MALTLKGRAGGRTIPPNRPPGTKSIGRQRRPWKTNAVPTRLSRDRLGGRGGVLGRHRPDVLVQV